MLTDSTRRHLKLLANLLFIAIAFALFILNIVRYARVYLSRHEYRVVERALIVPVDTTNVSAIFDCSASNYSSANALTIYQWFVESGTAKNRLFHVFFWWMMIFSWVVSVIPSFFYVVRYFQSNRYNVLERFYVARVNHFVRSFFSTTIFILPSFYMYTFEFDAEFCLRSYPLNLVIDILPFVLVTMIGLTLYFLMYGIIHQFYAKHRLCCAVEWIAYGGLCCLTLLMTSIILFSATIIFYIWIVSFIEQPLRLAAILLIVQMPFLPLQLLID